MSSQDSSRRRGNQSRPEEQRCCPEVGTGVKSSGRHCNCDVSHMIWGVRDSLTEVMEHTYNDFTHGAAPGVESYDFSWRGP